VRGKRGVYPMPRLVEFLGQQGRSEI